MPLKHQLAVIKCTSIKLVECHISMTTIHWTDVDLCPYIRSSKAVEDLASYPVYDLTLANEPGSLIPLSPVKCH